VEVLSRPRKPRYRYRVRRLTPLLAAMLAAGVAGVWVGAERPSGSVSAAAVGPVAQSAPAVKTATVHHARPPRLLTAGSALAHTFKPALIASAGILVDGDTGRVLWGLH